MSPFDEMVERLANENKERANPRNNRIHPASQSTIEALAYQLCGRVDALREPSALRRLSELDEAQMHEIADRLTRWRWGKFENGATAPNVRRLPQAGEKGAVPPWTPDEIETFMKVWMVSRDKR
jgi:hypothetical protein